MTVQARVPAGVRTGGRWTTKRHAEPVEFDAEPAMSPRDFGKHLGAKYGAGIYVDLHAGSQPGSFVVLDSLFIPKEQRNRGIGRAIMADLIAEADRQGWRLALTPDDVYGSSKSRLVTFYRSFGFVPNKGLTRDFKTTQTMLRHPTARRTHSRS